MKAPAIPDAARTQILAALPAKIFAREDIKRLLTLENIVKWGLNFHLTPNQLIDDLSNHGDVVTARFEFPDRAIYRFLRGKCSTFEVVQSLKDKSYFTHYTALYLHGFTEQTPKTIYLNFEQHLPAGGGTLTQPAIDRAFKGRCRVSHNVATFDRYTVTLLNGAHTGQLGVVTITTSDGAQLRVSEPERALLEAVVRPVYSGGVFEVAKAFVVASDQIRIPHLVALLKKMHFTYPYHQSVGFYLERAGKYMKKEIEELRQLPMNFDFYLDYNMRQTEYNERWRLYVPKGF